MKWSTLACLLVGAVFCHWARAEAAAASEPANARNCDDGAPRQRLEVALMPPEGADLSTVVIDLSYDSQRVAIPGTRNEAAVQARFDGFPAGAISAVNDMDGTVRVVVAASTPLPVGQPLFTVAFDVCGGDEPDARDYSCAVSSCVAMIAPIDGCRCIVRRGGGRPA